MVWLVGLGWVGLGRGGGERVGGGGGGGGARGTFPPKRGFLKIQKFNPRLVKEKRNTKKCEKNRKKPGRVRNGSCRPRTISGPNGSTSTTEICFFF